MPRTSSADRSQVVAQRREQLFQAALQQQWDLPTLKQQLDQLEKQLVRSLKLPRWEKLEVRRRHAEAWVAECLNADAPWATCAEALRSLRRAGFSSAGSRVMVALLLGSYAQRNPAVVLLARKEVRATLRRVRLLPTANPARQHGEQPLFQALQVLEGMARLRRRRAR